MPINANIPLASTGHGTLSQAISLGQQDKRRNELAEIAKTESASRNTAREAETARRQAEAEAKRKAEADRANLESIAAGAVGVKPLLDNIETIPRAVNQLSRRIEEIEGREGDASDTKELLEMIQAGRIDQARIAVDSAIQAGQAQGLIKPAGGASATVPTAIQERNRLLNDAESDDPVVARSARIQLGLDPRATGSAAQTIATTPGLTDDVAASTAAIKEASKFGELTGASRSRKIDEGFATIESIDKNVRNIDRAVAAIDEGASTGAIESRFFPTIREATVGLEQIQGELALDVVGATTFGALSKGELDLAREVALPTNLPPAALRQYLIGKKEAQGKLRAYYQEQIDFLDQGGTVAGFVRMKGREPQQEQAEPKVIKFDAQGNPIG